MCYTTARGAKDSGSDDDGYGAGTLLVWGLSGTLNCKHVMYSHGITKQST